MRRPRWTLLHATVFSAVVIACSDDPSESPNPKETPAPQLDRAVDADGRHEDRTVHGNAPREPGAEVRDTPREKLDKTGDKIDDSFDRAGEKIENAGNKAADGIERAGEKIDGAAKKTSDEIRKDNDAPREPGSDR